MQLFLTKKSSISQILIELLKFGVINSYKYLDKWTKIGTRGNMVGQQPR